MEKWKNEKQEKKGKQQWKKKKKKGKTTEIRKNCFGGHRCKKE